MDRSITNTIYRLWALEKFASSVKVFIALAGVMLLCWWQAKLFLIVPLFLGVIAGALADTEDNWQGRVKASIATLLSFTIAVFVVIMVFANAWLFAIALALLSFCLTMLGALGNRYNTIGMATLVISVDAMLNLEQQLSTGNVVFWTNSLMLIAGAAWYSVLSIIWSIFFANQPVQQALSLLFFELAKYLKIKASMFEPIRQLDEQQLQILLAKQNSRVVNALNETKDIIIYRMKGARHNPQVSRYLRLYFLAQDIHERASSSHYPYKEFIKAFFHSDILFRCQRLLLQHSKACRMLAEAIRLRVPFVYEENSSTLEDLQQSIEYLKAHPDNNDKLLFHIMALADNLTLLNQRLLAATNPDAITEERDTKLFDQDSHGLRDITLRLLQNLTPKSLLFRYAIRLSIALLVGYAVMLLFDIGYGYLILLTIVFVCRPNFGATKSRLVQRIIGTVFGLLLGWIVITSFNNPIVESSIVIVSGVLFFIYRTSRYSLSTTFMTLMILCCFHQMGNAAFTMIIPRLVDTFIGCIISVLAAYWIFPDWQAKRLNQALASVLHCNSDYLKAIMLQYREGKQDHSSYRVARRDAHNADAALSTTLANMLLEPNKFSQDSETGFRFLVLSHTMLGYISALGAHRDKLQSEETEVAWLEEATARLAKSLDEIADDLYSKQPVKIYNSEEEVFISELAAKSSQDMDSGLRLIITQLELISQLLPRARGLAAQLQHQVLTQDVAT